MPRKKGPTGGKQPAPKKPAGAPKTGEKRPQAPPPLPPLPALPESGSDMDDEDKIEATLAQLRIFNGHIPIPDPKNANSVAGTTQPAQTAREEWLFRILNQLQQQTSSSTSLIPNPPGIPAPHFPPPPVMTFYTRAKHHLKRPTIVFTLPLGSELEHLKIYLRAKWGPLYPETALEKGSLDVLFLLRQGDADEVQEFAYGCFGSRTVTVGSEHLWAESVLLPARAIAEAGSDVRLAVKF
ncbi:hypothetical protein DFH27DRAFT_615944 [Peziza echinospora]|nr:hypothetical protein DFH27DRAFT_615944 [Peziza echinospora]